MTTRNFEICKRIVEASSPGPECSLCAMFIDEYITEKSYCVQMLLESRRWGELGGVLSPVLRQLN
jgi:hypothetical protein